MKTLVRFRWLINCLIISYFLLFTMSPASARGVYGKTLCKLPDFHCIQIKRGQSWESLWPNDYDRDIVMRVNRLNIRLYPGLVVAVPNNLAQANIMDFSPFPKQITAPNERVIFVSPITHAWGAYDENGSLVRWGPASPGADWCHDIGKGCHTKAGSFKIYSLGSSKCFSTKFPLPNGGAPMPYCMYFHGGQALHGEPNGLPGYHASHGCVRLYVTDAEWLRYDFAQMGTKVVVLPYNAKNPVYEEDEDDADERNN